MKIKDLFGLSKAQQQDVIKKIKPQQSSSINTPVKSIRKLIGE